MGAEGLTRDGLAEAARIVERLANACEVGSDERAALLVGASLIWCHATRPEPSLDELLHGSPGSHCALDKWFPGVREAVEQGGQSPMDRLARALERQTEELQRLVRAVERTR